MRMIFCLNVLGFYQIFAFNCALVHPIEWGGAALFTHGQNIWSTNCQVKPMLADGCLKISQSFRTFSVGTEGIFYFNCACCSN